MRKVAMSTALLLTTLAACHQDPDVIGVHEASPTSGDAGDHQEKVYLDAGTSQHNDEDASTPHDMGAPEIILDAGESDVMCNVVHLESLGIRLTSEQGTCGEISQKPSWSFSAVTAIIFTRPSGKQYHVLVYEKLSNENFEDWMRRSEIGDSYLSSHRINTKSHLEGFVYTSNDHGDSASVHVTVPGLRTVYYISSDQITEEVSEDFLQFMRELKLEE